MPGQPRPAALCLLVLAAIAAGSPASSSPKAAALGPCETPECRQFDFWVGNWEVRTPAGKLAGLLMLAGEFRDGRMVLSADAPADSGRIVTNRIIWEKLADGRVSQHWEVSSDGGRSWTDAFMGYYRRMKKGTR